MANEDTGVAAQRDADAAARARALAPDTSFLVRAPAGSGKTELVIQRFLRLLALVDEPEAILAVTFTRKAAGEMRQRVLKALEAADGAAPAEAHKRLTWELARAARERDAARGWNLLTTPARLAVQTLDGLALTLVMRMPWLARQGAPPQPIEDAAPLYREASRRTLRALEFGSGAAAEAARSLVRHLGADLDASESLLAALLEHRDQWMTWMGGVARLEGRALEAALMAPVRAACTEKLRQAAATLARVHPLPAVEDVAGWRALAESVLTLKGTLRAKKNPLPHLTPAECAALHRVRDLPDGTLASTQLELMEALCLVLPLALLELKAVFREVGACDFAALTLTALEALGGDANPSTLAFALDAHVRHIFVDEFQDTSRLQGALIERLTADWQPGDGRTLFVVGDPMQSIYGFRNAEVHMFLAAERDRRLGPVQVEPLTLSRNFRSQPAVVDWCNHQFAPALSADIGNVGFTPGVAAGKEEAHPEARVHVLYSKHDEAAYVAELVRTERDADGRVAILALARTHLAAILPELRRRNIRFKGTRLLKLNESPVVGDLMALTRALNDPADRVAWLAVLRAPWCGLTLADLHALCGHDKHSTIGKLWNDEGRRARMSEDGRARAERTMSVMSAAAERRGRDPLRRLVGWCWQALEGDALVAEGANGADAAAFFQLLDELDDGAGVDMTRLQKRVDELYAPPDPRADEKVEVMTIHQAKGLEFDTVIVPGLSRSTRHAGSELLRWFGSEAGLMVAARAEFDAKEQHPVFDFVGALRRERETQEQARLLYVAATRARRRLHVVAAMPVNKKGEFTRPASNVALRRLWPTLEEEFRAKYDGAHIREKEPAGDATEEPMPLLRRRMAPGEGVELAPPETSGARYEAALPGNAARVLGVALHALLREIAESAAAGGVPKAVGLKRIRARLRAAGVLDAELEGASEIAGAALEHMLADERGRWILEPHPEARCEWEISGLVDGRVVHSIIDRTFVDGDTRWIVDYKTAEPGEGQQLTAYIDEQTDMYRAQLDGYGGLLRRLDPRPIRLGLYFPLAGGWREWPYI